MFDRFGGKRALALRVLTPVWLRLRGPRDLVVAPASQPARLVFICEGNICRSAYAAAYARARGYDANSLGLRADDGSPAHPGVAAIAKRRGIEMGGHRARRFRLEEVRPGDLVLVFEYVHAMEIIGAAGAHGPPVRLLGSLLSPWTMHIHDPYGLHPQYFERCLTQIERAVDRLASWVGAGKPGP